MIHTAGTLYLSKKKKKNLTVNQNLSSAISIGYVEIKPRDSYLHSHKPKAINEKKTENNPYGLQVYTFEITYTMVFLSKPLSATQEFAELLFRK